VLRELCGSFEHGHLHPDCPPDKVGRFRLDLDGAHWVGPWPRPAGHTPDWDTDFPAEPLAWREANGFGDSPYSGGGRRARRIVALHHR
jgi:hypothetical protein